MKRICRFYVCFCYRTKIEKKKTTFHQDAYRPLGKCTCFSFSCHHQMSPQGGRSPNEQVWSSLKWSPPDTTSVGRSSSLMPEVVRSPGLISWGIPYHVTYPMIYLMLPITPMDRQTPVKTLSSQTSFAGGKKAVAPGSGIVSLRRYQKWNRVERAFIFCSIFNFSHETFYIQF